MLDELGHCNVNQGFSSLVNLNSHQSSFILSDRLESEIIKAEYDDLKAGFNELQSD